MKSETLKETETMKPKLATRVYPTCCTSAYCGSGEPACRTCPCMKEHDEFKQWVEDHKAIETDPVWSMGVYTATI